MLFYVPADVPEVPDLMILVAVSHSSEKNKQINDGRELQTYDDVQVDFRTALSAYVRRAQPV